MRATAIITVRVDEELKRKMEEAKWIKWSEVIRDAIRKKLEEERKRNVAYAVKLQMELLSKQQQKMDDTTEIIRKFRDERK